MADTKVQNYINSINSSIDDIVDITKKQSEEVVRWKPSDDEWSILQILSHVREATLYWLGEMETVLAEPGSKWGRGLKDSDRLEAVANVEGLDVTEAISKVDSLKQEVTDRLGKVSDEQLEQENPHRNFEKFGNKPVSFLIEHFIVEHTEGHFNQIKRNLSKRDDL